MGSHYIRVYSVDDSRLRAALGSRDASVRSEWLQLVRRSGAGLPKSDSTAREEAVNQLVEGGVSPGERPDGHHFGFAFLELCKEWSDRHVVLECYVSPSFPGLWELAAQARPNPFGVPTSPYGLGHVGWHDASDVARLRRAFAAIEVDAPGISRLGGTPENLAAIDSVLSHAESVGRGIIVSWAA